ncbi:aggregation-promoting factor C-terminal-like domain-containing protein [Microbacterium sp. NPDC055903]
MLHAHTSRAQARTAALARAHADVTARHPLVLGIALGAVLSVAIVTSSASSAAAAVEDHSGAVTALLQVPDGMADATPSGAVSLALPLAGISEDAAATLAEAQGAVSDAQAVTADVSAADLALNVESTTIDTTDLEAGIDVLTDLDSLPPIVQAVQVAEAAEDIAPVTAATGALRTALTQAQEKKAAEERAAAALAAANTVDGAKATAKRLASSEYGWGSDQFSCLVSLWTKESGWNYRAYNAGSGATGIPQALPGSKMATAGSDWKTNATTQITWGLSYIDRAYGSPCAAWSHSQATDWY